MRTYPSSESENDTERAKLQQQSAERRRRLRNRRIAAALIILAVALIAGLRVAGVTLPPYHVATSDDFSSENDAWMLVLVNDSHPMEPYQPELMHLRNDQAVDARCYPDLQRMFDDARAAGLSIKINSSYRSREEQQQLLDEMIADGVRDGLSEDAARQQALRTVAEPGTSEHETGLAIDVTSESQTYEDNLATWNWLAEHSWEYGWVQRYPSGKEDITGVDNEPWHYRYVGAEAAREMYEQDQCLEEYLR